MCFLSSALAAFGIAQSLQNMQPAIEAQTGSLPQNLSHLSKLVTLFHLRFGISIGPKKLYIYAYLEISNWIYNNNEIVRYLFILVLPDQMCEDGRRTVSWYSQRLFRQGRGEF